MLLLPSYFNCFFDELDKSRVSATYKIVETKRTDYPYQICKWGATSLISSSWEFLSLCISVNDSLRVMVKEMLSDDLADEILHGQATVNTDTLLVKMEGGERSISIHRIPPFNPSKLGFDVSFDTLVERRTILNERS